MNLLKAALVAPILMMLTACDPGLSTKMENATNEEMLAMPIPSDEEIAQTWEEANELRARGGDDEMLGVTGGGKCRSGVMPPDRVKKGVVTLTFDDGPSPKLTSQLLDVLAKYNVKATFFMLGSRANSAPKMLSRVMREGHIVANHSTSHPNFHNLSKAAAYKQISATDSILAPYMNHGKFFRFPYGNASCAGNDILDSLGYQPALGWHVDTLDWKYAKSNIDLAAKTFAMVQAQGGGIILMHDIHSKTVNSVESLIRKLQNAGYHFTNIDDASVYPKLNRGNNRAQ